MTGEAAVAAWPMAFPLAGAAIDDEGAVNATPLARTIAKATFFIVASFIEGLGRLTCGRVSMMRGECGGAESQRRDTSPAAHVGHALDSGLIADAFIV